MSAATRTKERSWLKVHYDKVAIVAVLVVLLASALFLLLQNQKAQRALTDTSWDRIDVGHQHYEAIDISQFRAFARRLEQPPQMEARDHALMVSELRVVSVNPDVPTPIPYDAEVCPWTQYPQPTQAERDTTGDGIPDQWLTGFGLDPLDPDIGERDLDGDGFTVREEFEAGTSPVDAEDHPSHALKLRWRQIREIPFRLRFQGVHEIAEGDYRFQLNLRERDRTFFVALGEMVEGYRLVDFERRTRPGPLGPIDGSVLKLERADGRQIELRVDTDVRIDERVAELVFLVDDSIFRVREGSEITLMNQPYKVVDIRRDTVLILDENRNQEVVVEQARPQDRPRAAGTTGGAPAVDFDFEALLEQMGQ